MQNNTEHTLRAAHAGPARVALLCDDGAIASHFTAVFAAGFNVVGVIVEPNMAQRRHLRRKRRWAAWAFRWYHKLRATLTGENRFAAAYFRPRTPLAKPVANTLRVESINAPEVAAALREWRPDITVCCGTTVLGATTLAALDGPILNVHGGALPELKGNHAVFFALATGRPDKVAATVHVLTAGLDAGPIVRLVPVGVAAGDTPCSLYCRVKELGVRAAAEIVREFESGHPIPLFAQPPGGTVYRHRDRTPLVELRYWLRRWLAMNELPDQLSIASTTSSQG